VCPLWGELASAVVTFFFQASEVAESRFLVSFCRARLVVWNWLSIFPHDFLHVIEHVSQVRGTDFFQFLGPGDKVHCYLVTEFVNFL
jgi:hypothetical protein